MKVHFVAPQFLLMDEFQAGWLDPMRVAGLKFKAGTPEKRAYWSLLFAFAFFQVDRWKPKTEWTHNIRQPDNRLAILIWNDFTTMLNDRLAERGQ